ncbi:MAG: hypothetical protein ACLTZT_07010 [Butyricimonas faecalis]
MRLTRRGGEDLRGGVWNHGFFPDVVVSLYAHGCGDCDSLLYPVVVALLMAILQKNGYPWR